MENTHTDVRVYKVNERVSFHFDALTVSKRRRKYEVHDRMCVIIRHSDDRKLCEVLALGYAQKLENKELVMRREADTREARLAQKRQEKAEKKLQRKRDELQKEKEKR